MYISGIHTYIDIYIYVYNLKLYIDFNLPKYSLYHCCTVIQMILVIWKENKYVSCNNNSNNNSNNNGIYWGPFSSTTIGPLCSMYANKANLISYCTDQLLTVQYHLCN